MVWIRGQGLAVGVRGGLCNLEQLVNASLPRGRLEVVVSAKIMRRPSKSAQTSSVAQGVESHAWQRLPMRGATAHVGALESPRSCTCSTRSLVCGHGHSCCPASCLVNGLARLQQISRTGRVRNRPSRIVPRTSGGRTGWPASPRGDPRLLELSRPPEFPYSPRVLCAVRGPGQPCMRATTALTVFACEPDPCAECRGCVRAFEDARHTPLSLTSQFNGGVGPAR